MAFDELEKAYSALGDVIQEHDSKKEDVDRLIKMSQRKNTFTAEERSKVNALTQKVRELDKESMGQFAKKEKLALKAFHTLQQPPMRGRGSDLRKECEH